MSISDNVPVSGEVLHAFVNTLVIALISVVLAFVLSMIFGVIGRLPLGQTRRPTDHRHRSFRHQRSPRSGWVSCWLLSFRSTCPGSPPTGMGASGSESFSYLRWADFKFAVMPIIALALPPLGIMTRTTRSSMAEILNQDFIQTLRAKGLSEAQVILHAIVNIMPQAVAMLGLQLGYLIGGSVLVETVFTWPGTGYLSEQSSSHPRHSAVAKARFWFWPRCSFSSISSSICCNR